MQATDRTDAEILASKVHVPDHVVHRAFVRETVILNLETGKYHGLNRTAGRMLEVVEGAPTIQAAAVSLAEEFEQPQETIEADLCALCRELTDRNLIELKTS